MSGIARIRSAKWVTGASAHIEPTRMCVRRPPLRALVSGKNGKIPLDSSLVAIRPKKSRPTSQNFKFLLLLTVLV